MLRLAVFALFVAAVSANPVSISPVGVVIGVLPCGSKGQVLQIRVTDCTELPCDLKVGSTYTIEVDFVPSADHPFLVVTVSVFIDGKETTIINTDVNTPVTKGRPYTVAYPLKVSGSLVSKGTVALRIQVGEGGITELCGLATANIFD